MSKQGENLEIERRWLLRGLPSPGIEVKDITLFKMTSIYILSEPLIEVRLRKTSFFDRGVKDTYCLEAKVGLGLTRQESPKMKIDKELYCYYLNKNLPILYKEHWEILCKSGLKIELNLFLTPNSVKGLILAEIEFNSEKKARKFTKKDFPDWLKPPIVKEVTDDARYNSKNLARNGRPDPE